MKTQVSSPVGVTDRERDVLVLVAGHLTNLEIAERLSLSVRTVESHVSSVIRKLGVSDRRALARRAQELDLLSPRRLHNWPRPASRFVGRGFETADVQDRVSEHRWVTVTGPGGVGKTRLTTHAVEQVARDRPDGAWFVDLSQVASPEAVIPAVAAVVGVVEPPGRSLDDTLAEVLSRCDAVLVIDNCEHLIPTVAAYLDRLVVTISYHSSRLEDVEGSGDGRVYHLFVEASESRGGSCQKTITVSVPHESAVRLAELLQIGDE